MTIKRQRHTAATLSLFDSDSLLPWKWPSCTRTAALVLPRGETALGTRRSFITVVKYRRVWFTCCQSGTFMERHERRKELGVCVCVFMWRKRWLNPGKRSSLASFFFFSLSPRFGLVVFVFSALSINWAAESRVNFGKALHADSSSLALATQSWGHTACC